MYELATFADEYSMTEIGIQSSVAWIDVATGTITGYRVCLSENKTAVKNSL